MAMMVSVKRVGKLLEPQGFQLVYYHAQARLFVFSRNDPNPDLFQRVRIHCAGKRGEAAEGDAEVSVIRGANATKGLVEDELLLELASEPERGWTVLGTNDEAKDWEQRFAQFAPQQAAMLARKMGAELLAATAACRAAAAEMRERMGDIHDLLSTRSQLARDATAEQLQTARRLAEWPGVLQIAEAELVYEVATIAIVIHATEISSLRLNVEADPLYDRHLMWLIQILVDRIITENSWKPSSY